MSQIVVFLIKEIRNTDYRVFASVWNASICSLKEYNEMKVVVISFPLWKTCES